MQRGRNRIAQDNMRDGGQHAPVSVRYLSRSPHPGFQENADGVFIGYLRARNRMRGPVRGDSKKGERRRGNTQKEREYATTTR